MPFRSILSLIVIATFCLAPSIAQAEATAQKKSNHFHIDVKEIKSNLGITAWFVEEHEIPVVSVALAFRNAGSASDPKGLAGMAEFISSTLDEGSGTLSSQKFKEHILKHNIELELTATPDFLQISFRTTKKNINVAFATVRDMISKPLFGKEALERVKNQMSSGLKQSLHNEGTIASQKLMTLMYGNHPYAVTIQQTLNDLPKITDTQMRQFIKERFTRDQLIVAVVGDISPSDLKEELDKTFTVLPEKSTPITIPDVTPHQKGQTVTIPLNIPQASINFAQPGVKRDNPAFYATFLLMKILGQSSFSSRLMDELREKGGLVYGIFADVSFSKHAGLLIGQTGTKNSTVEEVIDRIQKVWAETQKGITQTELDTIKKQVMGSFAIKFSSTINIAKALLLYQFDNLGTDYINKRNSILAAVTLDDINQVAKEILKPEQLTFVVVGKPNGLTAQKLSHDQTSEGKKS